MRRLADVAADALERLDARSVYRSGCIEWQGALNTGGYGQVRVGDRNYLCHRLACAVEHGEPPTGKPFALHHCDNRPCIRPDHLYWGDRDNNVRDAVNRGRHARMRQGACHVGHPFDGENTYWRSSTRRRCRACEAQRERQKRQRVKQEATA